MLRLPILKIIYIYASFPILEHERPRIDGFYRQRWKIKSARDVPWRYISTHEELLENRVSLNNNNNNYFVNGDIQLENLEHLIPKTI